MQRAAKHGPVAAHVALALLGLQPSGCKCGSTEPQPVGSAAALEPSAVAPPPTSTALPAKRPKRFSISYGMEPDPDTKEYLLLGNLGARQASHRGRRAVAVMYSPSGPIVDRVYEELRTYACDKVETELQRGEPKPGVVIQMTAGQTRKMINDKDPFEPTTAWAGAFEGCVRALEQAFAVPGSSGYVQLEIRFPADSIPVPVSVETDLGPDHRGIEWRDDGATAVVYVAKIRPVDLQVRSGGGETTVALELAQQRGIEIEAKPDARPEELAVHVTTIEDAAEVKGDVLTGPNARIVPLGAPRLDLAGEPAAAKPMRLPHEDAPGQ